MLLSLLPIKWFHCSHLRIEILKRSLLLLLSLLLLSENFVILLRCIAQLRRKLLIQKLLALKPFAQVVKSRLEITDIFLVLNQSRFLLV